MPTAARLDGVAAASTITSIRSFPFARDRAPIMFHPLPFARDDRFALRERADLPARMTPSR
jgi:hypothetical protein